MTPIHMTEAEVSNDFAAALRKVDEGQEVIVDRDGRAVAIIKAADPAPPRTIDEQLERARRRDEERGYKVTLDEDYAADMRQIVSERKPWIPRFSD